VKLILAIDGGGIRGILPGRLIQAMQEGGCYPQFDLISGTSTGGIIACGLVSGITAKTMVELYTDHGNEVFDRGLASGLLTPKYSAGKLETLLQSTLGTKKLSEVSPELLIPSYCIQLPVPQDTYGNGVLEGAKPWFFNGRAARENTIYDFSLWQVARATSAAPTYFPPASINNHWMVDGGVFANNPGMCALAYAMSVWPGETFKILSIGTGSKIAGLSGSSAQHWGVAQWAPEIASIFMDGAADAISYQLEMLLGANFLRCETQLVGVNDAFDDASVGNIANLGTLAGKFIAENTPRIETFLKGPTT
jgi:uncharacterized protein